MTDSFIFNLPIQTRYIDFDMLGHLNNSIYLTYFETARIHYFKRIGWDLTDATNVVANFDVNFRIPVMPEDEICIWLRTSKIGTKSFVIDYELRSEDNSTVYCTAKSIQVCVDKQSGQSIIVPDHIKNLITDFESNLI
jgi:acyl-CoA thioester hydrolase